MTTLLVDHLGVATPSGHKAFPTSEQVASSSESALRETCRLGYRAPYVLGLARGIVDGSLDLDEIADQSQPTEELFRSYRKLPGIGPYGAAHLLAMDGRHDYIAVDTEFRSFVRRVHFKGREVSDEEMLEVYRGWGRWKYLGYWSELWMDISRRVDERPQ